MQMPKFIKGQIVYSKRGTEFEIVRVGLSEEERIATGCDYTHTGNGYVYEVVQIKNGKRLPTRAILYDSTINPIKTPLAVPNVKKN